MNGMQAFLHMGGYAFYVWGAYGASAALLVINALLPVWRERRLLQRNGERR